jgi:ribose transport system permease protein
MSLALFSTTTLTGHTADNLGAIAAVVIGGTSLFGGRGLVAGSVVGAQIPATLASGFVIIGVNPYWQYIAVGMVLIGAVYLDGWRRRTREHT